jgi:hypothetical protein
MDALTLFGLFAVTVMLVFYALEPKSPRFILAFAGACLLASLYGFIRARGRSGSSRPSGRRSPFKSGARRSTPRPTLEAVKQAREIA